MEFLPGVLKTGVLHPLLIHFPIVFVLTALLFDVLWHLKKSDFFRNAANWMIYLGAVSGILTVATGYVDAVGYWEGQPASGTLHTHWILMMWATALVCGLALFTYLTTKMKDEGPRKWIIVPLIVISLLMAVGADEGGVLVYKYGVNVDFAE